MTPAVLLACLRGNDRDERAAALEELRSAVAKGGSVATVAKRLGVGRMTLYDLAALHDDVRVALGARRPGLPAGTKRTRAILDKARAARWGER